LNVVCYQELCGKVRRKHQRNGRGCKEIEQDYELSAVFYVPSQDLERKCPIINMAKPEVMPLT
jgi:hypothetical protein